MLLMIKNMDLAMHKDPMYRSLSQKFGQMIVNGPNQAKNDFLVLFCLPVCWHLLGRSQLPVFQKGMGSSYLQMSPLKQKTIPAKRNRQKSLSYFGWSIFQFWHTYSIKTCKCYVKLNKRKCKPYELPDNMDHCFL